MTESDFVSILHDGLREQLKDLQVSRGENLIYKVTVSEDLEYRPRNPKQPKRGDSSFQTDLLVKDGDLPLVVIELKYGSLTTHDILTYSAKALNHKDIYPYLRYGLIVGGQETIHRRFFTHNMGFDFALAIQDTKDLRSFVEVVREQVNNARALLRVMRKSSDVRLFSTNVEARYV